MNGLVYKLFFSFLFFHVQLNNGVCFSDDNWIRDFLWVDCCCKLTDKVKKKKNVLEVQTLLCKA